MIGSQVTAADSLSALWWTGFADTSLRAAAVLLLACALVATLRRSASRSRYLLWNVALISVLVVPMLKLALPAWQVELPNRGVWRADPSPLAGPPAAPPAIDPSVPRMLQPPPSDFEDVAAPSAASPTWTASWRAYAAGLWAIGVVAVASWLLWGLARAHRFAARATPLTSERWRQLLAQASETAGLTRRPRLLASREVDTPMTWGHLRPVVVLPEGAEAWSDDCLRVVLLHELVHLRRGDWVLQLLAQASCVAYWFNPLAWIAARLHATERERSCDDEVLALGTRPTAYATHLLDVSQLIRSRTAAPLPALRIVRRASQLEGRIMRILSSPRRGGNPALTITTLALIVLLSASIELGQPATAQEAHLGTTTSHHDDGSFDVRIRGGLSAEDADESFHLRVRGMGDVEIDGETVSFSPYATLLVETEDAESRQWLRVTADAAGEPGYDFRVDGEERPFDGVGRQWLAETLRLASHQREISSLRGQRSSLRGQISSIRGQQSSLRGQISSVRGQQSHLRGQISKIRGQQSSLRGQISSIRGQQSALRGQISRLRGQISSLRAQKRRPTSAGGETLRSDLTAVNAKIDEQIVALEAEIRGVEAELEAFDAEGRIRPFQAELDSTTFQTRIDELQRQIEELGVGLHVREIQQQIDDLDVSGRTEKIQREIEGLDVDRRVDEIRSQKIEPSYRALRSLMNDLHVC